MAHRLARSGRKRANLRRPLRLGAAMTISGARLMEGKMSQAAIAWPKKLREMESNHFDSTVWNDFRFRDGDVVIATYGKAGTTWTQQIVGQVLFNGSEDVASRNRVAQKAARNGEQPFRFHSVERFQIS
jgi:hypothetical protein